MNNGRLYVAETTFDRVCLDWGQRVGFSGRLVRESRYRYLMDAAQCTYKTAAHGVATDFVAISALWSGKESAALRI